MKTAFINIKQLLQIRNSTIQKVSGLDMKALPLIENAFLIIENDVIIDFGEMQYVPKTIFNSIVDCKNRLVLPTFCDSHTHLVFAENRDAEFEDRINGLTYEDIAARGGGILNSAKKINDCSFEKLYDDANHRLANLIKQGTGAIEIKSGYGLTFDSELKMLRVIKKLKQNFQIPIKATFLGAHAYPAEYKHNKSAYINLLINDLLPIIAQEKLADFIDVFCETNYFSVADTEKIIQAGKSFGLPAKIHVNQFTSIGGLEMACRNNALSVDHLEILTDDDLEILKQSETIAVALPSCSFFIGIPYTNARKIIDSGCALAVASDYNPGTSPSGNMQFVVSLACIKMKITPAESINAATLNGAFAMGVSAEVGSISTGKKANFIITKPMKSFREIPYLFGDDIIEAVYINGKMV